MNILLTGASGFLGSIFFDELTRLGHHVDGLSRKPNAHYVCDLSQAIPVIDKQYDIVIHAAGKAHVVPKTQAECDDFYQTNVEGTKHLLKALDKSVPLPQSLVFISSVAVYGCDAGEIIDERQPLNGDSPYALSKIQAEKILMAWGEQNHVPVLIFRLPLIAGPNPPGNLGSMVNAIKTGRYVSIGKGDAKKSVVMANDIPGCIVQNMNRTGIYNLTDDCNPTVAELEESISMQLNKAIPKALPFFLMSMLAKIGDLLGNKSPFNSAKLKKLTSTLTFSCEKAKKELGWQAQKVKEHFKIV